MKVAKKSVRLYENKKKLSINITHIIVTNLT